MTDRLFVLGGLDPEMERIQKLLNDAEELWIPAEVDGRRVHPGNAYRATLPVIHHSTTVIVVECVGVPTHPHMRVDHHRPGDPGYGRPPVEYWQASSIGQVCALLGEPPTPELRIIAAADHCLAAAYRGECPGVDPAELMEWRIASRAEFQRRPIAALKSDVEAARKLLRELPKTQLAPGVVAADCGDRKIAELPEASARDGVCFISAGLRGPDGRVKVVCQSGTPEQITAFMRVYAPAQGLVDIYGDPARGFAGGYRP